MAKDIDFDKFVTRVLQQAHHIEVTADEIVVEAFVAIGKSVIRHNPLWSGQSKLNWTASVSRTLPRKRFVNVARSNAKVGKRKGGYKGFVGGREGSTFNIKFDRRTALTAGLVATKAVEHVARTYKHPIQPQLALHGLSSTVSGDVKPPSIYLSNSIKYIGKLWSGVWPTNPRTLRSELLVGNSVVHGGTGKRLLINR